MSTVYLNWKGPNGRETVDEFTPGQDTPAAGREFRAYVRQMVSEYHRAGMAVYQSSRPCAGWKS
jgi:hypothetical protein